MSKLRQAVNSMPWLRRALSLCRRALARSWMLLCRVKPLEEKIVVINYYGRGFGDNGKAIVKCILKQAPDTRILWAVDPGQERSLPEGVEPVRYRSAAYYRELATARVWVDNSRQGSEVIKRRGQFYLQAWHGPISFKKIEKDVEDKLSVGYVEDAKHDSKMADLILSGSTFFTELCRRTFWYDGEILECGTPRLDAIFHPTADPVAVRKALGVPEGKRIAMYAPTFRADFGTDCYRLDFEAVLDRLQELTGDEWVMAVRLHPNVATKADFIPYSDRIINATPYPDLYELLPLTDLLISDYSSCSFEAGMIGKRVAIFALDVEDYRRDRDLYFEFDKLPFPFCQSNRELLEKLPGVWGEDYPKRLSEFNESLGLCENGTAAETVAKRILDVLKHGK